MLKEDEDHHTLSVKASTECTPGSFTFREEFIMAGVLKDVLYLHFIEKSKTSLKSSTPDMNRYEQRVIKKNNKRNSFPKPILAMGLILMAGVPHTCRAAGKLSLPLAAPGCLPHTLSPATAQPQSTRSKMGQKRQNWPMNHGK